MCFFDVNHASFVSYAVGYIYLLLSYLAFFVEPLIIREGRETPSLT